MRGAHWNGPLQVGDKHFHVRYYFIPVTALEIGETGIAILLTQGEDLLRFREGKF